MTLPSFILASKSPRRQQLLRDAGFDFEVRTREVDESFPPDLPAREVAPYLAARKAEAFADALDERIVLTADTVVVLDERPLNKPADRAEALAMLRLLSGRVHEVVTGVCLFNVRQKIVLSDTTRVHFRTFSEEEMAFYVDTFAPFDKAGAYGAQDWIGLVGITRLEGSYFNVMGLPVHRVYAAWQENAW